jgi:hypothetical protein
MGAFFTLTPPLLFRPSVDVVLLLQNGSFNPKYIPGCQLWLDGSDPNGTGVLPANGATITAWNDKSGNGNNFSNYTGTTTFSNTIQNNQSAMYFNGSATLYNTGFSFPNTNYSFFVIANNTINGGGYHRLINGGGVAVDAYIYMGTFGNTVQRLQETGSSWNDVATNVPSINTYQSWAFIEMNVSGPTLTPYVTGNLQTTKTGTTGSFTGFSIGGYYSGGFGQSWIGSCGELLVYNSALGSNAFQQVEGHLAWKWGIQASASSDTIPIKITHRSKTNLSLPTPIINAITSQKVIVPTYFGPGS